MAKLIDITGKPLSGEWGTDDEIGKGIPVLRTTNFTNIGAIDYRNVVTRSIIKKNLDEKFLRDGDIIIEKSGGSDKFPVGRVVYFDGEEKRFLFNNFTGVLRVKDKDVWYPRYVFYALYENYRRGGTRPFENKTTGLHNLKIDDYVSRYEVKHNTYNKQVLICNYLDILFGIMKKREKQLEKMDKLIKARFFELFINTDYRYEKEPLNNNIKEMFIGPFGSAVKNEVFVDKEKAFCMVYEQKHAIQKTLDLPTRYIDRKKFDELKRFTVMGGDIIVSCRGTIGEIYSVPDDAPIGIMHPSIMKIRLKPEKYCNLFFVVMLNQFMKENVEKSNGSGIKMAITAKDLGKELFVIPPIKEQMKFEKFVNQIDKSKLLVVSPPQIHIYKTITLL